MVRFWGSIPIKRNAPPLGYNPVNYFEFRYCNHTPPVKNFRGNIDTKTSDFHDFLIGLPGCLILFDPLTFVSQRRYTLESCLRRRQFL